MKPTYSELEKNLSESRAELATTKAELAATKAELATTKAELAATKAELAATKAELSETKDLLKKALSMIVILQEEVQSLKDQINKNSKNSSKPPSSDQKSNTDDKSKKDRKNREGKNRPLFPKERIDRTVDCCAKDCPHCGSDQLELLPQFSVLQQAELPEVRAVVTEYVLRKSCCSNCNQTIYGQLPEGIPYSAFGTNLMGLLASLTGTFHLAKREAMQLIKDLYGIEISLGSMTNIEERVSQALDPIYNRIHNFILRSRFPKHFDETTWRDSGKRHYAWIATCEQAAIYRIDRRRSKKAFNKLIKGMNLQKIPTVSDRYGVYNQLKGCHQDCLAHLIRDFKNFAERDGPDGEIGTEIENLFRETCHLQAKFSRKEISKTTRNQQVGRIRKKVECWFYEGLANGTDKLSGLCDRLLETFDQLWTFTKIEGMDPTNNLAERDLRKLVIWRKKSYGTRSCRGKKFVERITTITQTLRKQKINTLKYIQQAIRSFYKNEQPSLINAEMGF